MDNSTVKCYFVYFEIFENHKYYRNSSKYSLFLGWRMSENEKLTCADNILSFIFHCVSDWLISDFPFSHRFSLKIKKFENKYNDHKVIKITLQSYIYKIIFRKLKSVLRQLWHW